jgi:hypothetical protein
MVTGRALLGGKTPKRCRVWFWCGEDPRDELDRRIAAACKHYGIKAEDLEGWLFVDTGRETGIVIATETKKGLVIAEPVVEEITATIRANKIDCLIIDPFVASHEVSENDNTKINKVVRVFADKIADPCNCAVELIHHVRKGGGGEVTAEDARGASALRDGARSVRAINIMTEDERATAKVPESRKRYFRIDDTGGKQSMMPPADASTWYRLESTSLDNATDEQEADKIGVVTRWQWPDASDGLPSDALERVKAAITGGQWRISTQAETWAGIAIAKALELDLKEEGVKEKVQGLLRLWIKADELVEVSRSDHKGTKRPCVEVHPDKLQSKVQTFDFGS